VLFAVKQVLASTPVDTSAVVLVADSLACQDVVDSYNANSDSSLALNSAYVLQADTTYVLRVPPAQGSPYKTQLVVVFDSAFTILIRMAGAG
jgi:hypothetical protein